MSAVLVCVDPDRIAEIWPHVSHLIAAAFAEMGDDSPELVKDDLDAGRALLWVAWDGSAILSAATTKLLHTSKRKLLVVTACAGREVHRWKQFLGDIEKYAADEKCDAVRIMGRRGWKAIFPAYREAWVCIEKELS